MPGSLFWDCQAFFLSLLFSRAAAEKLPSLAAATNTLSLKSSTTISFNAYL